jgi:sigma-E factor negative regulatory protein RseC
MIEELATVTNVERESITVTSQIKSSCNSCSQVDTCGSGQVAKVLPKRQLTLTLPYPVRDTHNKKNATLVIGDCVVIGLPERDVLSSAGQVYLFPLAGLVSFSAFGQWLVNNQLFSHELLALGLGVIGGYIGFKLAKFGQNQSQHAIKLQPRILRVLPKVQKVN